MAFTSNHNGSLTIYVDRTSVTKSLSISESKTLSNPQGKIYGPSLIDAWDTNDEYIPSDVYFLDGDNSGKNYIAYTFYVFNSGVESLDYSVPTTEHKLLSSYNALTGTDISAGDADIVSALKIFNRDRNI